MDILNEYMIKKTSYSPEYPQNDKTFLKLPKNEINNSINKHMKEIVPETIIREYIEKKALDYDEYISFRKIFSYQYGALMAMNYILSPEAEMEKYPFTIVKQNQILKSQVHTQFRLSRNILNFITKTHVNACVFPAMAATTDAFSNTDLNMKQYLQCQYQELPHTIKSQKIDFSIRIEEVKNNFVKVTKLLELAEQIGSQNDVAYQLKYWF